MTTTDALSRRIRRRETHASRAVPAIAVALLAILALAWVVTETVLAALGAQALLLSPTAMVAGITALPTAPTAALVGGGIVLVLAGLALVVTAIAPGRLARHVLPSDRAVVVVHDEVIGSALVRTAADVADTDPDRAEAIVGARRATVRVTPSSGVPLDREAVATAVADRLASFGLLPALRSRVVVSKHGRVGA